MQYAHYGVKSKRTLEMCRVRIMEFDDRPEPAKRLERARKMRGFETAKSAAEYFGWKYETYIQHEQGIRGLGRQSAKYAAGFRISEGWLLTGEGVGPDGHEEAEIVPVVGYVGAGSEAHYYDIAHSPNEFAPIPPGVPVKSIANLVCVEIRGDSLGSILNGWRVYYDDVKTAPDGSILGELCVVGLPDGRVLVKKVRRGPSPGRYNLESQTEGTIEDVEIAWAAVVRGLAPK